ncbi:MAG: hypothetical protein ACREAZ_02980 [Nitrososphaera sp.]
MIILNRPLEVMVITGLNAAVGAILLLNGLAVTTVPGLSLNMTEGLIATGLSVLYNVLGIGGVLMLPVGAAFLGSAAGLFLGKAWGWTLSRALQVLGILLGFAFMYGAGGEVAKMAMYAFGMALSGVVLGFLYAPEVREFYGKQPVPHSERAQSRRKRKESQVEDEEEEEEPSAAEVE